MAKIRDDLDGVVYVTVNGSTVTLSSGDTIPDGAEVGAHLVAPNKGGRPRRDAGDDN